MTDGKTGILAFIPTGEAMALKYLGIILLALLSNSSAIAAGKIFYGSRVGMTVTIKSMSGLDTSHALIRTEHSRDDAVDFCRDYVQEDPVTENCINQQLSTRLNDVFFTDCRKGIFTDFAGDKFQFRGENPHPGAFDPKYLIIDLRSREIADGSSASGYEVNLDIFRALCPRTAPMSEVYQPPPESPSGDRRPDVDQTAQSAWTKAISLAKQRNAGKTCTAEAYQSSILSQLGIALRLHLPFKDEVVKGKSGSAKALREALAGNVMLYDLIEKMSTPDQVSRAILGSVWYSNDGGVGGSNSILHIEKNRVRELVIDSNAYKRRPVIWAYSFDAKTGELILSKGVATRIYKLEKSGAKDKFTGYELTRVAATAAPHPCWSSLAADLRPCSSSK